MTSLLIIAELGINHGGDYDKAMRMIEDAARAGCKCAKFQTHIVEDEYIPAARNVIPSNATENIYDLIKRCSLSEENDYCLKQTVEALGMQYLSTPFSRAAVDRLERLNVGMYKVGSGELNNYPLLKYIVSCKKPIILSTGMNDWPAIDKAVDIIGDQLYAILHCVSKYPTYYREVNLPRMLELKERYHVRVGLSDHSVGIWTALAAIALGAEVIEKHFTSNKQWRGPDIPISIDPAELTDLVIGADAISKALVAGEVDQSKTADFAFASVVSTDGIPKNMLLTADNIWVKRPGGGIPAAEYESILGKRATRDIYPDVQLKRSDFA